jgi:flagellar hook-length control protein FliK
MSALAATAPISSPINTASMAPAAPPSGAADNGFARCLDQARDNNGNNDTSADGAPQRPGAKKPPANTHTDRGERDARAGRAAATPDAAPTAHTEAKTPTDAATDDDTTTSAHGDAHAPDLTALLPGWALPPASVPAQAESDSPLQAAAAIGSANAATALPQDAAAARALAHVTPTSAAADDSADLTGTSSTALQAAAGEQRIEPVDLQSAPLPTTLHTGPTAATATALKGADAPQPPMAMLPAPIDSPAFAPSLATQLRWWASDGVQQAQLLLNPPEMGPVAVKILLDGRDARIDFSADSAATRGAIEAALPVLAAALDDGGLRLTGGGVHDGSAQHRPGWDAQGTAHRTTKGAADGATQRDGERVVTGAAATRVRGMVDLVA